MRKALSLLAAVALAGGVSVAIGRDADVEAASPQDRLSKPSSKRPAVQHVALTGIDHEAWEQEPDAGSGIEPDASVAVFTPQLPTKRFAALGVTWPATAAGDVREVWVRNRGEAGWSRWQELEKTNDHAPDPGSEGPGVPRGGTSLAYTGSADGVQVRVATRSGTAPKGMRLSLIDPGPAGGDAAAPVKPAVRQSAPAAQRSVPELTTAARFVPALLPAAPTVALLPAAPAAAPLPKPEILTRADWGADESLRAPELRLASTVKVAFVHHTVQGGRANEYAAEDVPGILRSLYAFEVQERGFGDFPYNFVVDRFGRIWQGRAGSIDNAVVGAHTIGYNTNSLGVAALGDFSETAPSPELLNGMADVIAWKLSVFNRDPSGEETLASEGGTGNRFPAGTTVKFDVVTGHENAIKTSCPGRLLSLNQVRTMVQQKTDAGGAAGS